MEPATIAVLAITAAFLGFCIWIERHSRRQERALQSSESTDDRPDATVDNGRNGNGREDPVSQTVPVKGSQQTLGISAHSLAVKTSKTRFSKRM